MMTLYILTTESDGKPIAARFLNGIAGNAPEIADKATIVQVIPAGTPCYDGFLISGFNWNNFFKS